MIRVIIGKKGTGKTKTIIELANAAIDTEAGHVVVIERGDKLRFDISHRARLIDSKEYDIKGYDMMIGFISGIAAANYDITHIFIDSIYKISGDTDPSHLSQFIKELERLNSHCSIAFTITISEEPDNVDDTVRKYIFN